MGDIPQDRLWTQHLKIIATVTKRRPTRPQYDGPALPWRLRRRGLSMASLNALTLNVASLSRRSSIIYHIHLSLASLGQNTSVRNPARAAYPRPLRGARSTSRYYGPEQQHHLRVLHIAHLDVLNVDISALFEPRELHDGRASPLTPQASGLKATQHRPSPFAGLGLLLLERARPPFLPISRSEHPALSPRPVPVPCFAFYPCPSVVHLCRIGP